MLMRRLALVVALLVLTRANASGEGNALPNDPRHAPPPAGISRAEVYRRVADLTALGRRLFNDPALSASGRLACASCHDPAHAFGPAGTEPVALGGTAMQEAGRRAVPSLKYLQAVPHFTEHYFESEDEGDESVDNGPTGGLTWDGRVDRGRDQARIPLLSPFEMANESVAAVVTRVRRAGYGEALRRLFGAQALENEDIAFRGLLEALETYEQDAAEFYPYSSKYDAYLAGRARLTPQEARGLALFNDPAKGDCARCHVSRPAADGTPPQFTDFGFVALGVPRNPKIPANRDPAYFDLGLCGPFRTDLSEHPEYCGLFRTPSLRNVALRKTFFHNGVFDSLARVVEFYAERETDPEKWYPRAPDGSVRKYDDLPGRYRANVNVEPPFDRKPGDPPALSQSEIADVVAFLNTLTDGYGGDGFRATQPRARDSVR
jgi:cytochrome c peroxidase